MPCSSDGYPDQRDEYKKQLDLVTMALCDLLRNHIKTPTDQLPLYIQEWWKNHQRVDRERELREAIQKNDNETRRAVSDLEKLWKASQGHAIDSQLIDKIKILYKEGEDLRRSVDALR